MKQEGTKRSFQRGTMLNLDVALQRVGGDRELLQEIARLLLDDYPRSMREINAAIVAGDAKRLEREAHSLKGSIANFGADPVVQAALELEKMGRLGDLSGAAAGLEQLQRALDLLKPELDELATR